MDTLRKSRNEYYEKFLSEQLKVTKYSTQARALSERLADIPMPEVMEKMGYEGVRQGQAHLYMGEDGRVAIKIEQQKARDGQDRLLARNSLDLVIHMQKVNEGREDFTHADGVRWLSRAFGHKEATAAYIVNREHHALDWLGREERGRGGPERSLTPDRDGGHDRGGPDRGGGPDQDGGRHSFGGR